MNTEFRHKHGTLSLDRTAVMGILNVTPDSFSDGGRYLDVDAAVRHALQMQRDGAAIIDIGAQSTRPGHTPVSPEEEWERLAPVLTALNGQLHIPLSVDTFFHYVATRALQNGVAVLNDVSGSLENGFPALAAESGAGLVMMARDCRCTADVRRLFETMLTAAKQADLPLINVCLDVGIGFHQDRETDLAVIRELRAITHGLPPVAVLCGASKKRVIAYCVGDTSPDERLCGTIAFHTAAVLNGVRIVRAHDVKEAVQAAAVADALRQ